MNNIQKKIRNLVVDTSAFIRNAPLQDMGFNIITEEDVVHEIKNKRQLRRLVVLPYDLSIKTADPENIKFVTEFAKKTGDYFSLSATDIKVIALTYQIGKSHFCNLRTEPIMSATVSSNPKKSGNPDESLTGFYKPVTKKVTDEKDMSVKWTSVLEDYVRTKNKCNVDEIYEMIDTTIKNLNIQVDECSDYEEDDTDDQDDDSGWITPGNICDVTKNVESDSFSWSQATWVACLTLDFAMQNVLKQIGLPVVTLDGRVIKEMRTFILRCYACYKTTSIMTKVFCPSCGNKTLKKVSVSVDREGNQKVHINFRRPISKKGKRFSLPTPQGGKHANNPILCEDQPIPDQRPTRLARTKNDPLQEDYIAGYSPFIMRDVYSKSAMLRSGCSVKNWMRKNPNEVRRKK